MLAMWAIPDRILDAAPESPYVFPAAVFAASADEAVARERATPSDTAAREALPPGGSVLDVGSGAGAASLPLGAGHVTAVDSSRELLDAFAQRAGALDLAHATVEGRWPDVAPDTPDADVVVCHHVAYNVAELGEFAAALDRHATRRVVLELTAVHPLAWMAPYWQALHGLAQPDRPTADDALDVLAALGFEVHHERWQRPLQMIGEDDADRVARIARRLCVGAERHDEVRRALADVPPPRERGVVTAWWDVRH
jgi:SAM-dependent methyltransferase